MKNVEWKKLKVLKVQEWCDGLENLFPDKLEKFEVSYKPNSQKHSSLMKFINRQKTLKSLSIEALKDRNSYEMNEEDQDDLSDSDEDEGAIDSIEDCNVKLDSFKIAANNNELNSFYVKIVSNQYDTLRELTLCSISIEYSMFIKIQLMKMLEKLELQNVEFFGLLSVMTCNSLKFLKITIEDHQNLDYLQGDYAQIIVSGCSNLEELVLHHCNFYDAGFFSTTPQFSF